MPELVEGDLTFRFPEGWEIGKLDDWAFYRNQFAKLGQGTTLRIGLHLEQSKKHSKLFPRAIRLADVQQRMKQLLKSVDPHPEVFEIGGHASHPWSVS